MIKVNLNNKDKTLVTVYEVYNNEINIPIKWAHWLRRNGLKNDLYYLDIPLCFDTETSHNHNDDNPHAWIYQWCISINNNYYCGRKPSEFIYFLNHILKFFHCDATHKIVIYVHNLSYDFCYIIDWLKMEYGTPKILAVKPHKILTVEFDKFVLKCSYLLSNRSLADWCDYLRTDIHKAVGLVDYDVIRYQDSDLGVDDWIYMVNDVACMEECINKMMILEQDDTTSIPLTNTGYVRRVARKNSKSVSDNRKQFINCQLDYDTYMLCRGEFRGAISGGNINLSGQTIKDKIVHYDFKSHYPSQLQLSYYPVTKFVLYYDDNSTIKMTLNQLIDLCKTKCVLMSLIFHNIQLKSGVTCPYETIDRCIKGKIGHTQQYGVNGKLINFIGYTRLALCELDLKWILKQYNIEEIYIEKVYIAKRGHIPKWLADTIQEFFKIKETTPKGIQYDKSKNNLNGIYGMCATDIVREEYSYDFNTGEWNEKVTRNKEHVTDMLEKYYKNRNNFMYYQFGCYCTAHARDKLMHIIADVVGYDDYIYCDTDSEFFRYSDKAIKNIQEYNEKAIEYSRKLGLSIKNIKGKMSDYGTFNDEEEDIISFRFLHSKCYAYMTSDNKLHTTIAGVSKRVIDSFDAETQTPHFFTNSDELQDIENLKDGFIFKKCGGTKSKYINDTPHIEVINSHETEIASACIISQTTKQLNEIDIPEPFQFANWDTE